MNRRLGMFDGDAVAPAKAWAVAREVLPRCVDAGVLDDLAGGPPRAPA